MPHRNAIPRNKRQVEARERALAAVARMRRENLSLSRAAKAERTNVLTVRRYAATALERVGRRGIFRAKASDRIARMLNFPTPQGQIEIVVRSSRTASAIAEYLNAVRKYLNTGDTSALARFRNKTFRTANGLRQEFITNPAALNKLADTGTLAIEGLSGCSRGRGVIDNDPIGTASRAVKRLKQLSDCPPGCVICGYTSVVAVKTRKLDRQATSRVLNFLLEDGRHEDPVLKMLLEGDHVNGRNHDPEFIVPLCRNCHAEVTEDRLRAGISMRPESNVIVRAAIILKGDAVFFERLAPARRRLAEELLKTLKSHDD